MSEERPGVYRNRLEIDGDFTIVRNSWIRKSGLSPAANMLYIYLLSHEVGYQITFSQIQRETLFGVKGIRSAMAELENKGWLKKTRIHKANGQLGSYRYELLATRVPLSTVAESTVAEGTVIKKTTNKEDNSKETLELFEVFWSAYPKKPGRTERKEDARKAFKSALNRASFEDILAGVEAYKTRHNGYPLLAHNWLKNDGWEAQAGSQPKQDGFWGL